MPIYQSSTSKTRVPSRLALASLLIASLVACGQGGKANNTPVAADAPVQMLDPAAVSELRASFLEVSGSDRVTFENGSTRLTPAARLQLERQALWLKEYDFVSVRFETQSASAKGVEDRRLALRRAEIVQEYLQKFGVDRNQFVGIDIEFGRSAQVKTLIDPFHFRDPDARPAERQVTQERRVPRAPSGR